MTALAGPVAEWFETERGITAETLAAFGVASRDEDTAVIPYGGNAYKYRSGFKSGERSFRWEKGIKPQLLWSPANGDIPKTVFLCEGETDTMRLWQELSPVKPGTRVVGLPGIETWNESMAGELSGMERVYVILDNDQDYNVKGRVDTAWQQIRGDLGSKARRIKLPMGVKDLCEFFQMYDLEDFKELVRVPAQNYKYSPLDLSDAHIPRPVDWLVEGLIAKGDVNLLFGDPGVGKSWISLSLALAIIQGRTEWLGRKLNPHKCKVMYVDEENPEDVIRRRLVQLGIQNVDVPNIRYLHDQGIRLDRNPDGLLEEIHAFEPDVVFLDSLTRIHTQDENNAGSIARLFNDGIKPLARESGAAVVLIHHANKMTGGSAYQRARGSGDIVASIDAGLDLTQTELPGIIQMRLFKSRRRLPGDPMNVQIKDVSENKVELVYLGDEVLPF